MNYYALDASAVVALLNQEAGADRVATFLPNSVISVVSFSEVILQLVVHGMPKEEAVRALMLLGVGLVLFDQAMAVEAARPQALRADLSLGARACIALARTKQLVAVTADPSWARLDLCEVVTIR